MGQCPYDLERCWTWDRHDGYRWSEAALYQLSQPAKYSILIRRAGVVHQPRRGGVMSSGSGDFGERDGVGPDVAIGDSGPGGLPLGDYEFHGSACDRRAASPACLD